MLTANPTCPNTISHTQDPSEGLGNPTKITVSRKMCPKFITCRRLGLAAFMSRLFRNVNVMIEAARTQQVKTAANEGKMLLCQAYLCLVVSTGSADTGAFASPGSPNGQIGAVDITNGALKLIFGVLSWLKDIICSQVLPL
mmetsp:Transcript_3738/g.8918  ORF Transcript_3738/g.8918 Transcript_3738/m.8918 type:complete len:141 (+) Transcript_3738:1048-1470(+)